MNKKRRRRRK